MEAREHFEAAAQALADAEAPGIAPQLRDEHLRSMRDHRALAQLADHLDWNDRQKAGETVPTAPAAAVPAGQSASMGPWAWVVVNRRELLRTFWELLTVAVWIGVGAAIGPTLHHLANSPHR